MKVRVLAFATASAALGGSSRTQDLPEGATVADLTRSLVAAAPALATLLPRLAIAVDGDLAKPDRTLADGCEVALLPPVSGG